MSKFQTKMCATLEKRRLTSALRTLPEFYDDGQCVDFFSNDYIGLSRSKELHEIIDNRKQELVCAASKDRLTNAGAFAGIGSTGCRLISGNCVYTMEVEKKLAQFYGSEKALMFSCGFMANLGVLSSVPRAEDIVLFDDLIHVSLHEGIKLSRAFTSKNVFGFHHNDVKHLDEQLQKYSTMPDRHPDQVILVVVESVYSMDGDMAPLQEMAEICQRYDASLIVDEAHGVGVNGERGEGLVHELGLASHPAICCRINTFGKAMGSHGAAVCGSTALIDYLVNYARSFIYTTAPAFDQVVAVECVHEYCAQAKHERAKLRELVGYFRQQTANSRSHHLRNALLPSSTPIQALVLPGNEQVVRAAQFLQDNKIAIVAIRAPMVPAGLERLRIVLHSYNTKEQVDELVSLLERLPVYRN